MPSFVWYFAYGGNMGRESIRSRVGDVADVRPGRLTNYEIVFNKKARGGAATANVHPAAGKTVYGVLFKIPESSLRMLDRFEGAPEHYRRIEVTVTDNRNDRVNAQAFIATKVEKGLRPAAHSLQSILQAAAEYQFPPEYVEEVKKAAGVS